MIVILNLWNFLFFLKYQSQNLTMHFNIQKKYASLTNGEDKMLKLLHQIQ